MTTAAIETALAGVHARAAVRDAVDTAVTAGHVLREPGRHNSWLHRLALSCADAAVASSPSLADVRHGALPRAESVRQFAESPYRDSANGELADDAAAYPS
jgi:hypothetical protein